MCALILATNEETDAGAATLHSMRICRLWVENPEMVREIVNRLIKGEGSKFSPECYEFLKDSNMLFIEDRLDPKAESVLRAIFRGVISEERSKIFRKDILNPLPPGSPHHKNIQELMEKFLSGRNT